MKFWLDTETVGFDPKNNFIIELAYFITDDNDNILFSGDLFMRPRFIDKFKIEQSALDINKITKEQILNYELEEDVIKKLISDLNDVYIKYGKLTMCGYNTNFDSTFVRAMFERLHYDFNHYFNFINYDVMNVINGLRLSGIIKSVNIKLGTMADYFGISFKALHNAKQDVLVTMLINKRIMDSIKL